MAANISVERASINGGIGCCKTAIHELKQAAHSLDNSYKNAGSGGWKDQKYAALGGIVEECCSALNEPIDELEDCIVKLQDLLDAVNEYDEVDL